ncbi:hypothetical protein DNL40_12195 [Xylanimonas oleitrophica]|uniref:Uncharacterized protein n=1 Tax=Xylanimonas oleitrophica TaxID=2607479 RepID=A0A2W5Y3L9_9MICO|nr:DUF6153 family protein [Xylanimonas oleitrophica]PZR52424.1 hypothetical protein DNL40_12195 [Xylanimonas oleitrophica]
MLALRTLRLLLADPRRRLGAALMVVLLILGVVTMHAMSGSSSAHAAPSVMAEAAQTAVSPHAAGTVVDAIDHEDDGSPSCDHSCGGSELMTAMCLMVLVVLLTLAVPVRRLFFMVSETRAGPRPAQLARALVARAPSLHALSISRT